MKKLFLLLLIGILLAACGQAGNTEEEPAVANAPAAQPVPDPVTSDDETETDTAVSEEGRQETEAEEAAEASASEDQDEEAADVNVSVPTGNPFEIRGSDWTKGADEPLVTIIEYGDFQ